MLLSQESGSITYQEYLRLVSDAIADNPQWGTTPADAMEQKQIPRPIGTRVGAIVAQALKERYRITACADCAGPVVHSKSGLATRCMACGTHEGVRLGRCWECGETIAAPVYPPALALANANGRANLDAMAVYATCQPCGGQAEPPAAVRQSWRKCQGQGCKVSLSGRPLSRGVDLCRDCRVKVRRQRKREAQRVNRCRSGVAIKASVEA